MGRPHSRSPHADRVLVGLLLLPLLAGAGLVTAAETRIRWDAGVSEIYSQDVLKIGTDPPPGIESSSYITSMALTASLDARTARSRSEFSYAPSFFAYENPVVKNHLDHRYRGLWSLRPNPRSTVMVRQGYSETTRQSGFTDLDGAGSEAGQPIIGLTRQRAWEIEPEWEVARSARTTVSVLGLYRGEDLEPTNEAADSENLIDTVQYGLEGGARVHVGRGQTVGGRLRADRYHYSGGSPDALTQYDRFVNLLVTWSLAATDRFDLSAATGAFRASGAGVDPVDGSTIAPIVRPTVNLGGSWRWRSGALAVGYSLGYSSGGGRSTAEQSQRGDLMYSLRWRSGLVARVSGAYIHRDPLADSSSTSSGTLDGRSYGIAFDKSWPTGWGVTAGYSRLRQEQEQGNPLDYGEALIGLLFRPPVRPERPPQPAPAPPANP